MNCHLLKQNSYSLPFNVTKIFNLCSFRKIYRFIAFFNIFPKAFISELY